MIKKEYNRNHKKWFVKKCIKAITTYGMITPCEPVCVALSGGKDSTVLLFILWYINRYAGLSFSLSAAHIKTAEYDTSQLRSLCYELEVEYFEDIIRGAVHPFDDKNICYLCSRFKRGALKTLAEQRSIIKIAYGHHADDVAETFFMNIIHGAKLGSFTPIVGIPQSEMRIIRPMIYLREDAIMAIHNYLSLPLLDYQCPYDPKSMRKK